MTEIVPYLPKQFHGPSPRVPIAETVNVVLYKLKSGEPLHYKPYSAITTNGASPLKFVS